MSQRRRASTRLGESLYDALGVARAASAEEIQAAYRREARMWHPRRHRADPRAMERYQQARRAYSVLGHPERRRIYDRYGKFGLDIAETAGEKFVLPVYVLSRRWGRMLVALLFILSCCCFGCFCCCGCCCGCCGANVGSWEDELEDHDGELSHDEDEYDGGRRRRDVRAVPASADDEGQRTDDEGQQGRKGRKGRRHVTYGQDTVLD